MQISTPTEIRISKKASDGYASAVQLEKVLEGEFIIVANIINASNYSAPKTSGSNFTILLLINLNMPNF